MGKVEKSVLELGWIVYGGYEGFSRNLARFLKRDMRNFFF